MTSSAGLPPRLEELTVQRLVQHTATTCIILFGSRQRDAGGPQSDIDLVIIGPSEATADERRGQLSRLFAHWPIRIDALWLREDEAAHRIRSRNYFLMSVIGEGRVLHGDVTRLREMVDAVREAPDGRPEQLVP